MYICYMKMKLPWRFCFEIGGINCHKGGELMNAAFEYHDFAAKKRKTRNQEKIEQEMPC